MEKKTAIVLSGGGAKGAYEAGALTSIVSHIDGLDIVTGASIGAINAAVFACHYEETGDMHQAAQAVRNAWFEIEPLFSLKAGRVVWQMILAGMKNGSWSVKNLLSFSSLVSNQAIVNKIDELIPDKRMSDLKRIKLAINATDLNTGKTVAFDHHNDASIREAVIASSAIPILFPASAINGDAYVDGGVFNNTPLKEALVLGATEVYLVGLKPKDSEVYFDEIADLNDFQSIFEVATRLAELILDKIMYEDLKNARRLNQIIRVIRAMEASNPDPDDLKALADLKEAIGYKKHGRVKSIVEFYDVAPSRRLDPPGTLGFDNKAAIKDIMELGERDARAQLGML